MKNFLQYIFFSKKRVIQVHILHELEKRYNNDIRESTFNIIKSGGLTFVHCDWGDDIDKSSAEYNAEINRIFPNFPHDNTGKWIEASFSKYIFISQKEFIEKLNKFYEQHNIKPEQIFIKGTYFSKNAVSTSILNRLNKFNIKLNNDKLIEYIEELHDFNYIKQISCPDKFKIENERGYCYDITDKGRNLINSVDNSYIFNTWQKLIMYVGLIYTIIQIIQILKK